jgi:alkyl sulfatase BDS1-like metallo-beta-lactamase superfamily hydrolase
MAMSYFGFDPQRALDQVRRLAADAPAQLADGFGRLVRDMPPERLEQVMRSPARRPVLDGIFWQMPKQLDAARARGVRATIRWCITGGGDDGVDTYDLLVEDGEARTTREPIADSPRLTITMDGVEFLRIISGNSDPMSAYFKGRIQLAGDIMAAAQLAQLFKMPGARRPSESNGDAEFGDPPADQP